jgi:hypothetical protein
VASITDTAEVLSREDLQHPVDLVGRPGLPLDVALLHPFVGFEKVRGRSFRDPAQRAATILDVEVARYIKSVGSRHAHALQSNVAAQRPAEPVR